MPPLPAGCCLRDDIPKLPQALPRYLPIDADRRLTAALTEHPDNELAALALKQAQGDALEAVFLLRAYRSSARAGNLRNTARCTRRPCRTRSRRA